MDITTRAKVVTDRARWAARGASFLAKLKATKAVWFPPDHLGAGEQAASAVNAKAKKATARSTGKAAGSANSRTRKARSGANKATGAVTKTARGAKS